MWSDWGRVVDLYVCRGVIWILRSGEKPKSVRFPAAMPLVDQLNQIQITASHWRERVFVTLGARLCPPVQFVPLPALNWHDQRWVVQKQAAEVWGLRAAEASEMVCEVSPVIPGLAAAMPKAMLEAISKWSDSRGFRLYSAAPMWSQLTDKNGFMIGDKQGLLLSEPDGTLVVVSYLKGVCRIVGSDEISKDEISKLAQFKWKNEAIENISTKFKMVRPWMQTFGAVV